MKIILTFFWIAVGALLLWFFAENLDQNVSIQMFSKHYEHVNLVTIIFVSTFIGLLLGALLMTLRILKEKARAAGLKRENKKLNKEIEKLNKRLNELQEKINTLQEEKAQLLAQNQKDEAENSRDLATNPGEA
jgi:uncharacterized protein YlxW (UPF0749 family)